MSEKTVRQMLGEVYDSIEEVQEVSFWHEYGFQSVPTNNGFIFSIYFNTETNQAVFVISSSDFVFEKAAYMVSAEDERDAQLKAAILHGLLSARIWNIEKRNMLDFIESDIRLWKEELQVS